MQFVLMLMSVAVILPTLVCAQSLDHISAPAEPINAPPALRLHSLNAYWENDGRRFRWGSESDRYYTNGVGVSLAVTGDAIQSLHDKLPFHEWFGDPVSVAAGLVVVQQMFTPENIVTPLPQPDDRPFAGYLYAGLFLQREGLTGDGIPTLDHFQLDVGVVGPSSLAEDAQIWIHDLTGDPEPRGWDNQLRDELALQLTIRKKWRIDLLDQLPDTWVEPQDDDRSHYYFGVQAIPEIGGTVGNVHRHVEAGATLRAGWNLPDDFGPGRLTNVVSATGRARLRGWSLYGFGRVTGRAVEHNLLLEGNTWKDSLSVDEETFVGEAQAGVALAYLWRNHAFALGYSQTFQTEEFHGQDGSHKWGAYTFNFTSWF